MRRYTVLLYPEPEEGGYSVLVPSLPGCVTQGDTVEEALSNAREAISGHVATLEQLGEDVPEEEVPPAVATIELAPTSSPVPLSA
jgi:predicted RNase H-like HicB family nuclease